MIEDENTSPSEREAAEAPNKEGEVELARLNQQIQETEEALPLRERIKKVFTKLGYALQALVIVAGLVVGSFALKAMNVLKSATKTVGNSLKKIGKKVGFHSAWPHRHDRQLHLQNGWTGCLLSR